eukprot:4871091-Pyramimonas_sp.AAC.1
MNHDTWYNHRREDLPHVAICGGVAVAQDDLQRLSPRGQPVGARGGGIAPWTTPAKRKAVCQQIIDRCSTGPRDSRGSLIRKPIH